ncbi:condensin subunit YCG1 KNAG_0C05410 [Huiozyma naganishii CBS 8797]|uniref:Nuclear condensin complex subunit 3 C-terminal domain-containing protein n=1 Tax=Huiozyma naganishii (strain ATCC MYA-139 / BCRC 22969 / CBS 8797 / KCTC 17520 / NBRC 10181 / NCYC 3082 / Yp74L-3) TaxID=1071383 RepID=J7S535_HUIN7|nr:hypothetical protein KNAG_0C05410 [Kazachstania naganishii CBS 8797]CCK69639.1 hypothetical protein KNAG_0C05410 [Kazachstania naganishii CBS 8797]
MVDEDMNQRIFRAVADVFQQGQLGYAGHRKHVVILKRSSGSRTGRGFEGLPFKLVGSNKMVLKVLPLKKNDPLGSRLVKLVTVFVVSLNKEVSLLRESVDASDGQVATEGDAAAALLEKEQMVSKFIDCFLRYILRGIESKDKNVRFGVCQIIAILMENLDEIDEDLFELLQGKLKKRVMDREVVVRTQAVFALTKFQDDEVGTVSSATKLLENLVQNDPAADVRRAAMLNMVHNGHTQLYIFERARDVNAINRRAVYSRTLKSLGLKCFDQVDPKVLDQLVLWGVEDRDESVRTACEKLIAFHWINLVNGDLLNLIEKLKVTKSKSCDKAVMTIFRRREDIVNKIPKIHDLWEDLTPEMAFLFRCFHTHCTENKLTEVVDETFPEASVLSNYIQHYTDQRFSTGASGDTEALTKPAKKAFDFIIEQLLTIAALYDFSDEIGRRAMLNVVRNMLSLKSLPECLIRCGHKVLKVLSINERDFVTMAIEIINDLRDEDIEMQEQMEKKSKPDGDEQQDRDSDLDDAENLNSFHSAVDGLIDGRSLNPERHALNSFSNEREATSATIAICLQRSSCMLELVTTLNDQNVLLRSLIDTLITPAVKSDEPDIKLLGIKNLGLCCLIDVQLATNSMLLLGATVSIGNTPIKIVALQVLLDIFAIHGTAVVDGENKVDSMHFYKLFYKVLKNDSSPKCQVITAEGLFKLFLADIFTDTELFESLIFANFLPNNSRNEALIQAFAFCIPVYCFSHVTHQSKMASIAAGVFFRLAMIWDELQTSLDAHNTTMLKPNVILQQLIHWTNPRKLVRRSEEETRCDNNQIQVLLDILNTIHEVGRKEIKKMIFTNIHLFYITSFQDTDKLKRILEIISDILETTTVDIVCKNALEKTKRNLESAIEEAHERSLQNLKKDGATDDEGDNADGLTNEQISMILEKSNIMDESDHKETTNTSDEGQNDVYHNQEMSRAESESNRKRNRKEMEEGDTNNESTDERRNGAEEPEITTKNVSFIIPENTEESSSKEDSDYVMDD